VNDANTELLQARLWIAVLNIDLQLYKASVYKLRWGTPGSGIDMAMPCYDEALQTLSETDWPGKLGPLGSALAGRIRKFKETLDARDSTMASSDITRLNYAFEDLRAAVRHWPNDPPASAAGLRTVMELPTDSRPAM
jgi:hypothetical protein